MKIVFAGEGDWTTRVLVDGGAMRLLRSYYFLQYGTEPTLAQHLPLTPTRMPKQSKRKQK